MWLTWRQHRMQLLATVAVLGIFCVLLFRGAIAQDVVKGMGSVVPALVGIFWGVPLLVREFEQGTYQAAWTQSVTRTRWLAVKFGLITGLLAAVGLGFGLVVSEWFADSAPMGMGRLGEVFGATGVVPAGWFVFAFALGTASGAVLRRMLPAMAVTIAMFAVLFVGSGFLRGDPQQDMGPAVQASTAPAGAVIVAKDWESAAGEFVDLAAAKQRCGAREVSECMRARGFEQRILYYPPDTRYWRFQWTELGLLAAGTVVFGGVVWFAVSRRPQPVA